MGEVRGNYKIGGVAGADASIFNSYAANKVLGDSLVGGLIGYSPDTIFSSYWNTEISGLDTSAGGTGLSTAKMMKLSSFAGWDTLGYDEYVVDGTDTCEYFIYAEACYSLTGNFIRDWDIDEGKSFPYLANNPYSKKSFIPIATPTVAAKWQERPPVASLTEVDGELVGEWLDWVNLGDKYDTVSGDYISYILRRDTLYYGYRIGVVNEGDTVWDKLFSAYNATFLNLSQKTKTDRLSALISASGAKCAVTCRNKSCKCDYVSARNVGIPQAELEVDMIDREYLDVERAGKLMAILKETVI